MRGQGEKQEGEEEFHGRSFTTVCRVRPVRTFADYSRSRILPISNPDMTTNEILDKAAAELVEEILSAPEGVAWFFVIRAKLARLALDLKARRTGQKQ